LQNCSSSVAALWSLLMKEEGAAKRRYGSVAMSSSVVARAAAPAVRCLFRQTTGSRRCPSETMGCPLTCSSFCVLLGIFLPGCLYFLQCLPLSSPRRRAGKRRPLRIDLTAAIA
jgi:hypothetical protein